MSTKAIGFIVLGVATVVGTATGGYMALRRNAGEPAIAGEPAVLAQSGGTADKTDNHGAAAGVPGAVRPETPASGRTAREVEADDHAAHQAVRQTKSAATHPSERESKRPSAGAPAAPAPATSSAEAAPRPAPMPYQASPLPGFEPYRPPLEELTVARDSVIGIRLETNISSDTARVEDPVVARISRDVAVDGRTAISSGARLEGVVASVERGGKFKDRARVGVKFNSLLLSDGTRLPIETETIFRESESPVAPAATKVGASAAIGGILGAVIGGKKGAAIGSTVGAAGGTAAVVTGDPANVVLSAGTPLTVRLTEPLTVTVQRDQAN